MKLLLALVATLPLCAAWQSQDSRDLELIKPYRTWTQATKGWWDMTPSLALLCVGPPVEMRPPNPHVPRVFRVFVNAKGKAVMRDDKKPFPVGTIIVKEKYPRNPQGDRFGPTKVDPKITPELLTVMVKRPAGWEWFAASGDLKQLAKDNGTCRKCHESQKKKDYVFRHYDR